MELARIEATAQFGLHNPRRPRKRSRTLLPSIRSIPVILDTLLQIYAQTNRLQEALATSEQIIQADPERAQSYINQAMLHLKANEPDKAIASVQRILQKSPQQPQALLYKIFLFIQKKDYAGARIAIDTLFNVDPENREALLYKGVIEMETKAYAAASAL